MEARTHNGGMKRKSEIPQPFGEREHNTGSVDAVVDGAACDGARNLGSDSDPGCNSGSNPGSGSDSDVPIEAGIPKRKRMVVLAVMITGTFIASLSQSMLIAALPTIMDQFGVDATLGQLLTTSYIFTLGLISAMTAALISKFNTKYLFMAAMMCFIAGCAAALFAPSYWLLLGARLLQAGGAGVALPLVQVVALSVYPKEQYGRAMGLVGLIIGFAPAIGPTVSGFMIDFWGWKSIFIILGSIVAVIMVASAFVLTDAAEHERERFDTLSAVLYTVGFVCFMIGVTAVESLGLGDIRAYVPSVVGTVALIVFARRQFKIENPLLKLRCLMNRQFGIATVLVVVTQIALMVGAIMVPLFVQDIQGKTAMESGLTILPGAMLLGFLNPVTGRLLDKYGARPLIAAGCTLLIVGTLVFVKFGAAAPAWVVTVTYGIRIVGVACLMMPMTAYGCAALPSDDLAQGTAIMTSFRQIFGAIGSSILVAVMTGNAETATGIDLFGFGVSFEVQAAIVFAGLVIGLAFIPRKRKTVAARV